MLAGLQDMPDMRADSLATREASLVMREVSPDTLAGLQDTPDTRADSPVTPEVLQVD